MARMGTTTAPGAQGPNRGRGQAMWGGTGPLATTGGAMGSVPAGAPVAPQALAVGIQAGGPPVGAPADTSTSGAGTSGKGGGRESEAVGTAAAAVRTESRHMAMRRM